MNIYDLVNIEISGISRNQSGKIKFTGITPVNKTKNINTPIQNSHGSYQSIEITVPDTLIAHITSIRIILKNKTFTYQIRDLSSTKQSDNTHTFILPPEIKSGGSFIEKLFAGYPFNVILASPSLKSILFTLLFLFFMFLLLTLNVLPKSYQEKLINQLKEKKILYTILTVLLIVFFISQGRGDLIKGIVIFFYITFIIQFFLLTKKNFIFYILRSLLIIFIFFEILFGILNSENKVSAYFYDEGIYMVDTTVAWKNAPDCFEKRQTRILGNDTVFNCFISTDRFGRRISRDDCLNDTARTYNTKKKHAIFLGCSLTFGFGLDFDGTIPFLFENKNPGFRSYNYGVTGYGPHQMCLFFDEGINIVNDSAVPEDSGFCIYTFINDHLDRLYGGSSCYSYSGGNPDVYVKDNKLAHKKRSQIIPWFLTHSETMIYFNIRTTYPKKEKFYQRFADIINYMAAKYWEIKPYGDFYVGLYPGWASNLSWLCYVNKKIKILNIPLPSDFVSQNPRYVISRHDMHPSKELNSYYVNKISKSIFHSK
ncbi:MAG TPA: hypothetical protein PKW80_15240 [Bacteroidales bacterium]|nr:hypothetical protein [Bacteroidales bacterium]